MNAITDSLLLRNKREAIIAYIVVPVISILVLIAGILLQIFTSNENFALISLALITLILDSLFFVPEIILQIRKMKANKFIRNNEFGKVYKLIGKPPAPYLINRIVSEMNDSLVNHELLLIVKEDKKWQRRVSAIVTLGMRGNKAINTLNELKEITEITSDTYELIHLYSTIAIFEGLESLSLKKLRELYKDGVLKKYVDVEHFYTYTLDQIIFENNISDTMDTQITQDIMSEEEKQNMLLAHIKKSDRLLESKNKPILIKIILFVFGVLIGVFLERSINWLWDLIFSG